MSEEDRYDPTACPLGGRCLFDEGCAARGHTICQGRMKEQARGRAVPASARQAMQQAYEGEEGG